MTGTYPAVRVAPRPSGAMTPAESIIAGLPTVGLSDLGAAALMDRVDEKFLLPRSALSALLGMCASAYSVLEVQGKRQSAYRTTYFDTEGFDFYHDHLAGRLPRRKVRIRTYADTGISFLEIKRRDNHDRTNKARVAVASDHIRELSHLSELPDSLTDGLAPDMLHAVATARFSRITLVDVAAAERMTIDSGIAFSAGDSLAVFPAVICVEIKQARRGPSAALAALRQLRWRPTSVSKYCLGVASTVSGLPTHKFKPLLNRVHRMEQDYVAVASHE